MQRGAIMNRFINWLLGRKELTVVMLERKNYTNEEMAMIIKFADKMRKEYSCNCTLSCERE